MKKIFEVCVYHAFCNDGQMAATVAKKYHNENGKDLKLIEGIHGKDLDPEVFRDKKVLMVDFAPKEDNLLEIIKVAKTVTIIDHHVTAKDMLDGLNEEDVKTIFDNEESGATLTWQYFYPNTKTPEIVLDVKDRDIWEWKRNNTKYTTEILFATPFVLEEWLSFLYDNLKLRDEKYFQTIEAGKILLKKKEFEVEKAMKLAFPATINVNGNVFNVIVNNVSKDIESDLMNRLLIEDVDKIYDFALNIKFKGNGKISMSFRSTNDRTDVSEIAKQFNGGGHRNASGGLTTISELFVMSRGILDSMDG